MEFGEIEVEKLESVSKLFNIEPIGKGTIYIESLTSYLIRIANAHGNTIGTLINKIIGHELNQRYILKSAKYGGNRYYDGAKSLNGVDKNSIELVNALEKLTSRDDLKDLTLYRWKHLFTNRNLLKDNLAWCPECLIAYKEVYGCYYFPLIWNVKTVNQCKIHNKLLVSECFECKKSIPILHRRSTNEKCPYCDFMFSSVLPKHIQIKGKEVFFIDNTGKMMVFGENLDCEINRKTITKRIIFFDQYFKGIYQKSLRQILGIPKSTYHYWLKGKSVPTIENLLQFCYSLEITVEDFFFLNSNILLKQSKQLPITVNNRAKRKLDYKKIGEKMISYLLLEIPISMEEVARKVDVSKRMLYKNFPELSKEISKRYMQYLKVKSKKRKLEVKLSLEKAVTELQELNLPPTQRNIEKHLVSKSLLRERYAKEYLHNYLNLSKS